MVAFRSFGEVAVLVTAVLTFMCMEAFAATDTQKAEFLLKLVDYVEWPAGRNVGADGSVMIACVGESPVATKLQELAATNAGGATRVTVKILAPTDPIQGYQIVFISNCDKAELAKVLKQVNGKPVLTTSACNGFTKYGVMVDILDSSDGGSKVNFEVNSITVREAGLKIAAQLLKLATTVI